MSSDVQKKTKSSSLYFIFLIGSTTLLLDQLSKWWALEVLIDKDISLFWTLRLSLTYNTGAAFSFAAGTGSGPWISFFVFLVIAALVWQGHKTPYRSMQCALGLILGGALGNLMDRLFRHGNAGFLQGAVVDFIDLQWWPVFNVADAAVMVGAITFAILSLKKSE